MIPRGMKFAVAGVSTVIFSILLLCLAISELSSDSSSKVLLNVEQRRFDPSSFQPSSMTYSQSSTVSLPGSQQRVVQIRKPVGMTVVPGALQYYKPVVKPIGPSVVDGDPMGQWGDIFQRVTGELTTDTMEIANLDNQVRSYSLSSILLLTHHTSGRH
jgi:hypothetical protein